MSPEKASSAFVDKVFESKDPELRRLVASGLAPLPLPELLAVQVRLTEGDDRDLASTARASLHELDPRIVASVIAEGVDARVVDFFARVDSHPVVIEEILRLREVSRDLLVAVASSLESDQQELLLLRQDAIVERPEILDRLAENPALSSYAQRRIAEYRQHLLPQVREKEELASDVDAWDEDLEDTEEVAAIRAQFEAVEQEAGEEELDSIWKASEIKIRLLSVAVRMRLARGAKPLLRRILIRDQNPTVALAVLTASPITEPEVERVALSRVVVDDVLTHIATSKRWARRYKVVHSLCQNPRTPLNVSIRLLPRLSARHLQHLSRNRNVPEAIRSRALRLYRIKMK